MAPRRGPSVHVALPKSRGSEPARSKPELRASIGLSAALLCAASSGCCTRVRTSAMRHRDQVGRHMWVGVRRHAAEVGNSCKAEISFLASTSCCGSVTGIGRAPPDDCNASAAVVGRSGNQASSEALGAIDPPLSPAPASAAPAAARTTTRAPTRGRSGRSARCRGRSPAC